MAEVVAVIMWAGAAAAWVAAAVGVHLERSRRFEAELQSW